MTSLEVTRALPVVFRSEVPHPKPLTARAVDAQKKRSVLTQTKEAVVRLLALVTVNEIQRCVRLQPRWH